MVYLLTLLLLLAFVLRYDINGKERYRDECYLLMLIVAFMPFFLLVGYSEYLSLYIFYPYSSVIERSINQEREWEYGHTNIVTPFADVNEY